MTGNLVPNQPMRKFWEGFEHFSRRLKDDRGNPMLLKLKDWPPGKESVVQNFRRMKLGICLGTIL
jgi:lysine-specific demethylase 3